MKKIWMCGALAAAAMVHASAEEAPLKVLYVTGGGWHDYAGQVEVVKGIIREALPGAEITVSMLEKIQDRHPAFEPENWAEDYALVVYNKCNAPRFSDPEWIERVVRPHREGLPAVLIHGTLHNYWPDERQTGKWNAFCGVTSRNHERPAPVAVSLLVRDHPITRGLPDTWKYPQGELYRVHAQAEDVTFLAEGDSGEGEKHGVAWVHRYGEGRVFGTTIGHATETMKTTEFSTLLRQGIRWAIGLE